MPSSSTLFWMGEPPRMYSCPPWSPVDTKPGNTCRACTKSGAPPKLGMRLMSAGRMVSTEVRTWVVCSSRSARTSAPSKVTTLDSSKILRVNTLPSLISTDSRIVSYSRLVTIKVYWPAGIRLKLKYPSTSLDTPYAVPSNVTEANITASPEASDFKNPLTVPWDQAVDMNPERRSANA